MKFDSVLLSVRSCWTCFLAGFQIYLGAMTAIGLSQDVNGLPRIANMTSASQGLLTPDPGGLESGIPELVRAWTISVPGTVRFDRWRRGFQCQISPGGRLALIVYQEAPASRGKELFIECETGKDRSDITELGNQDGEGRGFKIWLLDDDTVARYATTLPSGSTNLGDTKELETFDIPSGELKTKATISHAIGVRQSAFPAVDRDDKGPITYLYNARDGYYEVRPSEEPKLLYLFEDRENLHEMSISPNTGMEDLFLARSGTRVWFLYWTSLCVADSADHSVGRLLPGVKYLGDSTNISKIPHLLTRSDSAIHVSSPGQIHRARFGFLEREVEPGDAATPIEAAEEILQEHYPRAIGYVSTDERFLIGVEFESVFADTDRPIVKTGEHLAVFGLSKPGIRRIRLEPHEQNCQLFFHQATGLLLLVGEQNVTAFRFVAD